MAQRGRVLVVDDDLSLLRSMAWMLETQGWDVTVAGSVAEALQVTRDAATAFDLLVCDVNLPGLLGPRLASIVLRTFPSMKVLYVSGDEAKRAEVARTDPVLFKPFTTSDLFRAVDRIYGVAPESGSRWT